MSQNSRITALGWVMCANNCGAFGHCDPRSSSRDLYVMMDSRNGDEERGDIHWLHVLERVSKVNGRDFGASSTWRVRAVNLGV